MKQRFNSQSNEDFVEVWQLALPYFPYIAYNCWTSFSVCLGFLNTSEHSWLGIRVLGRKRLIQCLALL